MAIASGKTKAARRILRITTRTKEVLVRRIAADAPPAPKRPQNREYAAAVSALRSKFLFPSHRIGKNGSGHASLSGLENAHNDVLDTLAENGVELPIVIYDFRHTFATRAAEGGMPLGTLAPVLGHSSIRMVMKYVHPTQQHQEAEMARFDERMSELWANSRPKPGQNQPVQTGTRPN
ncbi:MAG: tyrosine-type recombinase/integrase [Paludibaculum sp.]